MEILEKQSVPDTGIATMDVVTGYSIHHELRILTENAIALTKQSRWLQSTLLRSLRS